MLQHSSVGERFPSPIIVALDQHVGLLVKVLVTGAVLASSAYLGPRISLRDLLALALVGMAIAGLVSLFRWPALGPVAVVVAALAVPLSIGTGSESAINAAFPALAGTLVIWILSMLGDQGARFHGSRVFVPLLMLFAVAAFSFAFGQQPQVVFAELAPLRAQIGGLTIFGLSALALVLVAHQVRDRHGLQWLVWVFTVAGALYLAGRLAHSTFIVQTLFQSGADGSLFFTWLAALAFSQAVFNRALPWFVRAAVAGCASAVVYLGFFTAREWNSGWVPPLAAILAVIWFGAPRIGALITLVGGSLLALNLSSISAALLTHYKEYDILTREAAWTTLVSLIKVNPLIGLGPANYYWYTPLYSLIGYTVKFNSHQQYMDLLLQTGVLGLACFIWFVLEMGWLGLRLRGRVGSGFEFAFVCGAMGGLGGTVVAGFLGDWFLPFVYNIGFRGFRASVLGWVFLGGLVALDHFSKSRPGDPGALRGD